MLFTLSSSCVLWCYGTGTAFVYFLDTIIVTENANRRLIIVDTPFHIEVTFTDAEVLGVSIHHYARTAQFDYESK
jgi:hypothetical protein